jgi:hypothetical protein
MKNRNIISTAILSLLVCGLACTALAAGSAPVTVVNTPDVNVANTPNVIVGNTSPIPVTGTVTAGGTSNVNVVNTTAQPIPITGTVRVDDPARSGVQVGPISLAPGDAKIILIPTGEIFVIETASFFGQFQGATGVNLAIRVIGTDLTTGGLTNAIPYFLTLPPPDTTGQTSGSQALRVYAQGLLVSFDVVSLDLNNPPVANVSLSGYLVTK